MKNKFTKLIKFAYNGRYYQTFITENGKLAFLELDLENKYHYPEYNELMQILKIFYYDENILAIKKTKKKFSFVPKFLYKGILTLLTAATLTACGNDASTIKTSSNTDISIENDNHDNSFSDEIENTDNDTILKNELEYDEIDGFPVTSEKDIRYLEHLELADDDIDWKYANDYEYFKQVNILNLKDASAYETVYGYSNVSLEDIKEAVYSNPYISDFYKNFAYTWAQDWLTLYPDSDLSTFYHNVQTMPIKEINESEMLKLTRSENTVACYRPEDNELYVLQGSDFSKNSRDYIVLAHELTHSARSASYVNENGDKVCCRYYNEKYMGSYSEEALITNFAYQMQGLGEKSTFYTLQCSYYRIILDCIDYTGTDYMNHSVNYLIDKMDEFMGTKEAYHIISLIDCETALKYNQFLSVDYYEFDEIYSYLTRMYMKKHLTSDMSYDDAQNLFNNMMNEITFFFDKMDDPYVINYDVFEETFEECVNELGIEKGYTK